MMRFRDPVMKPFLVPYKIPFTVKALVGGRMLESVDTPMIMKPCRSIPN